MAEDPDAVARQDGSKTDLHLTEFARRTRDLARRLNRLAMERGRQPVTDEDRTAVADWMDGARTHSPDAAAMDSAALRRGEPFDYIMLRDLVEESAELIRAVE